MSVDQIHPEQRETTPSHKSEALVRRLLKQWEQKGREEVMSAKKIKTYYSAVEHLESFWEVVFNFIALKEAEGKQVASDLMTDCVATGGTLSNLGSKGEFMPRTSRLQEKAFQSLWVFLDDPALTPEGVSVSLEAVWETAGV